jgi:hypothetical protein
MMHITIILGIYTPSFLISVIGIIGNLVTIIALYYAKRKRRYGFHESWCTSAIYVINLAIIDFLYCLAMLLSYFSGLHDMTYEGENIIFNDTSVWWCTLLTHMQFLLGEWGLFAIAFISLMRAVAVTSNRKWETLCERKRNVFIFLLCPWIFTLALYAPRFQKLYKRNREMGWCDPVIHDSWYVENVRYGIHGIVGVTIIVSYIYIFWYVSKHSRASKNSNFILTTEDLNLINSRNIQIAKTMAIVAFSSIFLFLPFLLVHILHNLNKINGDAYTLSAIITYDIFILQYCINLFIYVWRKDVYRRAIVDIFTIVIPTRMRKKEIQRYNSRT